MPRTYKAVISREGLRWVGEPPSVVRRGGEVMVDVTVRDAPVPPPVPGISGERLVELFKEVAALDPFADIDDPVAWVSQQREDRSLPDDD